MTESEIVISCNETHIPPIETIETDNTSIDINYKSFCCYYLANRCRYSAKKCPYGRHDSSAVVIECNKGKLCWEGHLNCCMIATDIKKTVNPAQTIIALIIVMYKPSWSVTQLKYKPSNCAMTIKDLSEEVLWNKWQRTSMLDFLKKISWTVNENNEIKRHEEPILKVFENAVLNWLSSTNYKNNLPWLIKAKTNKFRKDINRFLEFACNSLKNLVITKTDDGDFILDKSNYDIQTNAPSDISKDDIISEISQTDFPLDVSIDYEPPELSLAETLSLISLTNPTIPSLKCQSFINNANLDDLILAEAILKVVQTEPKKILQLINLVESLYAVTKLNQNDKDCIINPPPGLNEDNLKFQFQ